MNRTHRLSLGSLVPLGLLVPLALAACSAEAPPPAAPGAASHAAPVVEPPQGTSRGEPLGDAPLVALADLYAQPDAYAGKRVRVEGLVTGVCAKRGCWINIGAEEGPEEVTFKVDDGVMVFPMSAQGGWVVAEGTASKVVLDVERARKYLAHKAEESGEPFDPASVSEPLTLVRLAGLGAVVRDR